MPKIVDVQQRRAEIAEACWRTITKHGIAGVTTRELAREAGVGAGVLFHYFRDKDEIILAAFELLEDRFRDHLRATVGEAANSVDRLRAMAYANLPLSRERHLEFGVWLSLWAHSYTSIAVRERYRTLYAGWREILANTLTDAIADGLVRPDVNPAVAAMQITGLTDGLVVQLLLNPDDTDVVRLARDGLDDLIASWSTAPVPADRESTSSRSGS